MCENELKRIIDGLKIRNPLLPTKFLYDNLGSILFEAITHLPQYNATRDELDLYKEQMPVIAEKLPKNACLVDLGAGNCKKAEQVIQFLLPKQYVAVDLPSDFFSKSVLNFKKKFPEVTVNSVNLDFSNGFSSKLLKKFLKDSLNEPLVYFYPGSTIGNFTPEYSIKFLRNLSADGILIGVDLMKPVEILLEAYDDNVGVTSAFNKNCLVHFNRVAQTNFDIKNWKHEARFNDKESRVEMHLVSVKDQIINSPLGEISFRKNQTIHTENSYKYTVSSFSKILKKAGFTSINSFVHSTKRYALFTALRCP